MANDAVCDYPGCSNSG